jgi:hypothetical protein
VLDSMDVIEEYIVNWSGSLRWDTCSTKKETALVTVGVECQEGIGLVV